VVRDQQPGGEFGATQGSERFWDTPLEP